MRNILLTGGKGFIGQNFIEQCSHLYNISSPGRSELELTNESQTTEFLNSNHFDYIIHAATIGVVRNSQLPSGVALNANLRAFSNIFKLRQNTKRIIQLGSGAEYGRPLLVPQIDENYLGKSIPSDEYGFSKLLCSQIASSVPPSEAVTLNLFGIFGPYEDYRTRFISNAIVHALLGLPIIINQNVEFDYVYIKDCINIILKFIYGTPEYSNYNITTGQPITLVEIAEIICGLLGSKQNIDIKAEGLKPCYTGCNKRLVSFLGRDFGFTPIKKAIEELMAWYEQRIKNISKEYLASRVY